MTTLAVPVVFTDANILYSSALRDIVIDLALADVIELHWSLHVLEEMVEALVRNGRASPPGAQRLRSAMLDALPEASVEPIPLPLPVVLPDPDDEHVLACALAADARVLLTFNGSDFPSEQLAKCGSIEAVHPDAFLVALLATDSHAVPSTIDKVRRKLIRPSLSLTEHLEHLHRVGLIEFSKALRSRANKHP